MMHVSSLYPDTASPSVPDPVSCVPTDLLLEPIHQDCLLAPFLRDQRSSQSSPALPPRWGRGPGTQQASPVMRQRDWYALRRAEKVVPLHEETASIAPRPDWSWTCELCGILIGPGYHEQELYLYPVPDDRPVCLLDRYVRFRETWISPLTRTVYALTGTWLLCCGGCAHHKRRMLPRLCRLLGPEDFTTNRLIRGDHEPERLLPDYMSAAALKAHRDACMAFIQARLWFFFTLFLFVHGISLSLFMDKKTSKIDQPLRQLEPGQRPVLPLRPFQGRLLWHPVSASSPQAVSHHPANTTRQALAQETEQPVLPGSFACISSLAPIRERSPLSYESPDCLFLS